MGLRTMNPCLTVVASRMTTVWLRSGHSLICGLGSNVSLRTMLGDAIQ